MNKLTWVVCDLDGTFFNIEHRRHFVERTEGRPDWASFADALVDDTVYPHIVNLVKVMRAAGHPVVFMTGRMAKTKHVIETNRQLKEAMGDEDWQIAYRPEGDFRPDHVVKIELMRGEGLDPSMVEFVLDDRDSVVKMWRDNGFNCLQVQEGKF